MVIVAATLAFGGFGLWLTGENVITGEVHYATRKLGSVIIKRSDHPGPYWLLTAMIGVGAVLIMWFSLWAFSASLKENRSLRKRASIYSSFLTR